MSLFPKDEMPTLEQLHNEIDKDIARDRAAWLRGEDVFGQKKKQIITYEPDWEVIIPVGILVACLVGVGLLMLHCGGVI